MFGNLTSCNTTVITSAGSIKCDYIDTIEKSILELSISKNNIQVNLTANSLSYFWTPKNNKNYADINYNSPTLQKQVPQIVDSDGKGKCNHGGEGSTSCSITNSGYGSCSVSCGTGYYACCVKGSWSTKQSCHCIKS